MDLPTVVEITDFKFVQLKKVLISPEVPLTSVNCIASSSKYGIIFVGYGKGFKVLQLDTILELDEISTSQDKRTKQQPESNFNYVDVPLLASPTSIALCCSEITLSVCILKDDVPFALMYDVRAFATNEPPYPFAEVRLSSNPGTQLQHFCWNPAVPSEFAVCLTDGSATIYGIENDVLKISGTLPPTEGIIALCWSPKGKQIVAGKRDGKLCQYKPNLQLSKVLPPPAALGEYAYVASVCWLATTLFASVYVQSNGVDFTTKLVLVSVPKGQSPTYIDFGDVCFGYGNRGVVRYWMQHVPEWKLLVCTSNNSIETTVIGYNDQGVWQQWTLEDDGRAELPLFQGQETFPIGVGIITCSRKNITISHTKLYPPMPILFLLSTSGVLCPFHMLNLIPGQPNLITELEVLSPEGQRKGRVSLPLGKPYQTSTPVQAPVIGDANPMPSGHVPAAKVNLLKKFPEEPIETLNKPSFSFGKPSQMPSNDSAPKSSKFSFAPVSTPTVDNISQPLSFQPESSRVESQQFSSKSSDMSQELSRKISRNILTPIAPSKATPLPKAQPTQEPEKVDVENALIAALLEEVKEFTKEINESRLRISSSPASVGSNEEMTQIRNQTHDMQNFCEDIKKTVQSINLDVHLLKGCVFDTFAVFEEARSLDVRNKDPVYLQLLKRRALDPVSARKLKEIRKLCQYFDSQLTEIHRRLDQDWEDYLDKKRQNRLLRKNVSGVETVYRTLYNNLNAVKSLEEHIDKMISMSKKKKLSFLAGTLYNPSETQKDLSDDLATLADTLLKTSVSDNPDIKKSFSEHHIKNVPKPLSVQKENALREFLCNRRVPTIKATTISNLKDSRLISAIQVMKETSWSKGNTSHSEVTQRENSLETDISKSDPEIKEVLSLKESSLSGPSLKPSTVLGSISTAESTWPTVMSTSAKSSISSIASGDTVITSTTIIPVSKSISETGGITQGIPVISLANSKSMSTNRDEIIRKPEVQSKAGLYQPANQAPPPNITLPFHSLPVHMVAKTNAALVSAPVMVPIPSKSESKTASPQYTSATNQTPVFSFGKPASSSSFLFSMGPKTTESPSAFSGTQTAFGPIKICEPTSFSAIGKPPATISSESKGSAVATPTSASPMFSFKDTSSVFSTSTAVKSPLPLTGKPFKEIVESVSHVKDSTAAGSLFKELGTPYKRTVSSVAESEGNEEDQYEDITPPETPQSELPKDEEPEELTKIIEISVPKSSSTPDVKVKTVPSSFSFKLPPNITSNEVSSPPKSTFSLAHLLKSDTSPASGDQPKTTGSFQFGGVVTKEGTPTFSFAVPSANKPASPTDSINLPKTTITPIAISSTLSGTSTSSVIKTVSASNVTIPTNASSTAFTPVTSSSDKEASPNVKLEEHDVSANVSKESVIQPVSKENTNTAVSAIPGLTEIESRPNEVNVAPSLEAETDQPPPPYPTGQLAFSIAPNQTSTSTATASTSVFGQGSSLFGKPSPSVSTAPASLFGQSNPDSSFGTPATQSSGSLFGNMTSFGQSPNTSFGQTATSVAAPVFGAITSQSSPFGAQNTGIFGQPAQQATGFGSPPTSQTFGQTTPSSGFGAFGQQQAEPSFTQAKTSLGQSPGGAFSLAKPLFGQSGQNVFGQAQPTTSPTGLFGQSPPKGSLFDQSTSFFGGLGGQPSVENANKNVFGISSFQNQSPSTGSNLFGSQSPSGFGTKFGNNSFTGGNFSAGGNSVAETGFGAFSQGDPQKTPTKIGAGSSPGFGAPPVFGGSPIFGGNTFGISPIQQSPSAFGGGFGTSNTATPMFDALASQAPTFGSLSQQPTPPTGFGTSPSVFGNSPSFGGQSSGIGSQSSAFTQWRQ